MSKPLLKFIRPLHSTAARHQTFWGHVIISKKGYGKITSLSSILARRVAWIELDRIAEWIILDDGINIIKRQVITWPTLFLVMLCTNQSFISYRTEKKASPAALSRNVNIFSEVYKLNKKMYSFVRGAGTVQ